MAAVANGTGLDCPDKGLALPPTGLHDLARVFRPVSDGGRLPRSGLVRGSVRPRLVVTRRIDFLGTGTMGGAPGPAGRRKRLHNRRTGFEPAAFIRPIPARASR